MNRSNHAQFCSNHRVTICIARFVPDSALSSRSSRCDYYIMRPRRVCVGVWAIECVWLIFNDYYCQREFILPRPWGFPVPSRATGCSSTHRACTTTRANYATAGICYWFTGSRCIQTKWILRHIIRTDLPAYAAVSFSCRLNVLDTTCDCTHGPSCFSRRFLSCYVNL